MTILAFENRQQSPMTLVVEPGGDEHQVPHLATAGIRYSLEEGAVDRTTCVVSEGRVEVWCEAAQHEIDIVYPSAFNRLSWAMCVGGGWCGGIVDGKPTTVDDLLPDSGTITARDFAKLVIRADGWPESEALPEQHIGWLESQFIEYLGAVSVDVQELRFNLTQPFENA
jgi:hypothetical protein